METHSICTWGEKGGLTTHPAWWLSELEMGDKRHEKKRHVSHEKIKTKKRKREKTLCSVRILTNRRDIIMMKKEHNKY